MNQAKILVIDDEVDMLSSCKKLLERMGNIVSVADRGADGIKRFEDENPDLVITDLKMPGMDGMEVLRNIKERSLDAVVIVFTGFGTVEDAVTAMKEGAFDFIQKPFKPDEFRIVVERALKLRRLEVENDMLKQQLEERGRFENIIGSSPAMNRVFDLVRKIADTQANVLITGESGTGKELIAKSIHANSGRKNRAFVPLNCGGLPEHLVESELFGHEKGAFTGASGNRIGLMEHASHGTFFLDEIGELPMNLQVKFLRVLEDRKIRRLGSNKETDIDIRLVSATNQDLEARVKEKAFREDLFYRINTFVIRLPALREREGDIPLLANHFLANYATATGKEVQGISPEAMTLLNLHTWPGNIRELMHAMERAVALASSKEIQAEDLPDAITHTQKAAPAMVRSDLPFKEAKDQVVEDFERTYIEGLLKTYRGNISEGARQSGIDRRTLHRLLAKYDIKTSSFG
ncbi:MAG: DNA-binding NtrC family response regulator [Candidatus Latescibacterota bacterium]|jgi:DNA-binding NtrC family response regulator